ncbi:MAG: hypothetical protein PVG11_09945 [Anaerolineae bacterium]|jgi:predicted flap endonuclease-1-like 5' DNA nuclease
MFRKAAVPLGGLLFLTLATPAFAMPLLPAEQEGTPWWLWIIIFAVLALFVGFMLWWWLHEPEEEALEVTRGHGVAPVVQEAGEAAGELHAATEEIAGAAEPEDLTVVEGIGPKIQSVLRGAGIRTFRELAAVDPERIEAILEEADPRLARLADPASWPEQAALAADGEWERLEALQRDLDAGRRN